MTRASSAAKGIRALASLVRTGVSLREALMQWHREAPREMQHDLERLSRRLRLGEGTSDGLERFVHGWGPEFRPIATALAIHVSLGGDSTRTLDAVARMLEERDEDERSARAMCSGVRLSGRMVAALPLAVAPLVPGGGGGLEGPMGLLIPIVGVALGLIGLRWMDRLLPRPSVGDPAAETAAVTAAALRAGASVAGALELLSARPPPALASELTHACRLVRLGCTWAEALTRSSDGGLRDLGLLLERASARGDPLEERLRMFVAARRSATRSKLEADIRRAPVLMALPLVLCVLPSFALLAVAPVAGALAGT